MFEPTTLCLIALLGLFAGVLGGMLGVGGSTLMIPGLVLLFGQDRTEGLNQHLYQAAAMAVNIVVAAAATTRHRRSGAMRAGVIRVMLPAAAVTILLGVWVSDLPIFAGRGGPLLLGRVLAVFLAYVVVVNLVKLIRGGRGTQAPAPAERITTGRCLIAGGAMGFVAGLLGIGGGAIAVPLQQVLLRLPLRSCIANSAAVMCFSAAVGAIAKHLSLAGHGLSMTDSLTLAALLAPTGMLGGRIGGRLTHVLPEPLVRIAFTLLMVLAAAKMAFP